MGLHSPRGRSLEIEAARDEFRVGRMRDLLEARLEEAVAEGAEWRARTAYASLRREGPGLRVRFREGEEVRTRFLVGADGARSRVARDLGLDRNTRWIAGVENLREVTMFPMNQQAQDLMMGAPSDVSAKQLRELNIRVVPPEKA